MSSFHSGMFRLVVCFLIVLTGSCLAQEVAPVRPDSWAKKVQLGTLENGYMIADGFYRSEQPSRKNMKSLESAGIKTLVNLRRRRKDDYKAKGTELTLIRVPINAWKMSYEQVVISLREIRAAKQPVLLHCIHGSDRTGAVAASYRMVEQGWTKEQAIDEFLHGGYGYHAKWFPKILRLLEDMDVEKLKSDVNGSQPLH